MLLPTSALTCQGHTAGDSTGTEFRSPDWHDFCSYHKMSFYEEISGLLINTSSCATNENKIDNLQIVIMAKR